MLLASERMLLPEGAALLPGWVRIEEDRIVETGSGTVPAGAEWVEGILAPGWVDVHNHGGGGATFVTEDPGEARRVIAAHRAHGTTTVMASLVTGSIADLRRQITALAPLVDAGELAGIHLEGPWLAEEYKGAHDAALLADPDPKVVTELLDLAHGTIRMVTIAPERRRAPETIELLCRRGVTAAVGHTAADFDRARDAIERGARGATHLFNAMPELRHRAPGPALALWQDPRVTIELIFDGVHVRSELAAWVMATAPGRVALVTDAMAAAGAEDGDYHLGGLAVTVSGGVARLTGATTIAGSTLTLDRAVRNAVAHGVAPAVAMRAASAVPARYQGLTDVGELAAGKRADVIELADDLVVRRVFTRGRWWPAATA